MVDQHLAQHPDQRAPAQMLPLIANFAAAVRGLRIAYRNRPPGPPSFLSRLGDNGWFTFFSILGLIAAGMLTWWFGFGFSEANVGNILGMFFVGALMGLGSGLLLFGIGYALVQLGKLIANAWDDRHIGLDSLNNINDNPIRLAVLDVRNALNVLTVEGGIINCGPNLEPRVIAVVNDSSNATVYQLEQLALELQAVYLARQQEQQQQNVIRLGDAVARIQQEGVADYAPNPAAQVIVQEVLKKMHDDAAAAIQPGGAGEPPYQPLFGQDHRSLASQLEEVEGGGRGAPEDNRDLKEERKEGDPRRPLLDNKQ